MRTIKIPLCIFIVSFLTVLGVEYKTLAQQGNGKTIIKRVLDKAKSKYGYEVEVERKKTRLSEKGTYSQLRAKPKAQVLERAQEKKSIRFKIVRAKGGKVDHKLIRNTMPSDKTKNNRQHQFTSQEQSGGLAENEALFTVDPEDLFAKYQQSEVTELSRTDDLVVIKIGPPPGPVPPDWPDLWLRATFDIKRDLLLKSELIADGEERVITEFDYNLIEDQYWMPSRKTIRIIEKDAVSLIEDQFGKYTKSIE